MKRQVESPGDQLVKAAMERRTAMVPDIQTDGYLPCHNGTTYNLHTHWRRNGIGVPPPERVSQPTPELTPLQPKTPPAPPGNNEAAQVTEIQGVPLR